MDCRPWTPEGIEHKSVGEWGRGNDRGLRLHAFQRCHKKREHSWKTWQPRGRGLNVVRLIMCLRRKRNKRIKFYSRAEATMFKAARRQFFKENSSCRSTQIIEKTKESSIKTLAQRKHYLIRETSPVRLLSTWSYFASYDFTPSQGFTGI